jgi:hypothetical protein
MSRQNLRKRNAASTWYVRRDLRRHGVKGRVLAPVMRNLRLALIALENSVARLRMVKTRRRATIMSVLVLTQYLFVYDQATTHPMPKSPASAARVPTIMSSTLCFFVQIFVLRGVSVESPSCCGWPIGAYLCGCPRRRQKNAFIQGTRGLALRLLSCLHDRNPLIFPRKELLGLVYKEGWV